MPRWGSSATCVTRPFLGSSTENRHLSFLILASEFENVSLAFWLRMFVSKPHALELSSPWCRTYPNCLYGASHSRDHSMSWAAPRHQATFTAFGELSASSGGQETQQIKVCELCGCSLQYKPSLRANTFQQPSESQFNLMLGFRSFSCQNI